MTSTPTPQLDGEAQEPARTVHIDTSLQIEQQKAEPKAKPVRDFLGGYSFTSTSSYARKEFKRAWLQDLNLIYKACKGAAQIGDVYSSIARSLYRPEVKRRLERCLDAINAFLSANPSLPLDIAVCRLRAHLGMMILGAYVKWERSVTHEFDGTGCIRAAERPSRAADGTIDVTVRDCRPNKIQCSVHQFFELHRGDFVKIQSAIDALGDIASAELKRTSQTIERASADPKHLCDNKHCRRMSDALIAVDGITADHFGANNPKEWETIASALGKPLLNPVSSESTK